MNFKKLKLNKNSRIKLKCFFTLILVFTMVISSIPNINIFADESYEYKCIGEGTHGYCLVQKLGDVQKDTEYPKFNLKPMLFNVTYRDSIYLSEAYCIDVNTPVNDNINYSISNIEDGDYYNNKNAKKIRAIVKNSYPYVNIEDVIKKFDLDEDLTKQQAIEVAITATQCAIWYYSNGLVYKGLQSGKGYTETQIESVGDLYSKLLELEGEDAEVPVAKILSKEPIIVSEKGDTVDIEFRFKIDGNNVGDDINYEIENERVNLEIIEDDELDEDGYKRIKVTNITSGENIKFIISGIQYIDKDIFLYKPEGGRTASQTLIGARSGSINISETFDYKCTLGEVEVTKVDSNDENIRLEGAEFTIKNSSGEVVKVITTDTHGTASTKLLPGEYTIKETKAPEGYKSIEDEKTFTISESESKKIILEFENDKLVPTSVTIEGNKVLEGKDLEAGMFNFELLDEEGNVIEVVKNSEEGKIQFAAITYDKKGIYEYKVREVEGNLGGITYDKEEFRVKVNIKDDGKGKLVAEVVYPDGEIEFTNITIEGILEFEKTDVITGEVIEGAEIKITCIEGLDKGKVIEFTSSKEGNKFELKAGKYTFEETQAPEGYELSTEVGTFEIKENGEVVKAELKNYPTKGSVKLIKVNKDDNEEKIQGTKFVLLASDKETIIAENLVTDSEGKTIVSNLEPGTYYFKEIEAASGYILDSTLVEVNVKFNQKEMETVIFENKKKQEVVKPVTKPNIGSPETSDTSIAGYTISGIVAIGALVGTNRRRKKNN